MKFNIGDPVMHWMYGLGEVIGIEDHDVTGVSATFYKLGISGMTLWVPVDKDLENRLRVPSSATEFEHLFSILEMPGEALPDRPQDRKLQMLEELRDGRADTLCRVIRDLAAYQQIHSLNISDQNIMKRVHDSLISEWAFSLSVSIMEAEKALRLILTSGRPEEQAKA